MGMHPGATAPSEAQAGAGGCTPHGHTQTDRFCVNEGGYVFDMRFRAGWGFGGVCLCMVLTWGFVDPQCVKCVGLGLNRYCL